MKVSAIEEAQDVTSIKVDEFFGSLFTSYMAIDD